MNVLVTGAAGFIGSNLCMRLLEEQLDTLVVGLDNLNTYYDVNIKQWRLEQLTKFGNRFVFVKGNIADKALVDKLFDEYQPQIVVNLAAQAGVRYSITNPGAYIESNLIGFYNILEACRHSYDEGREGVKHLVYASSSSVYGSNKKVPYSTDDKVDNPVSLYAATKKSNELMAHAYSKLYDIPSTGLRFFTVYGPAGRPDMAYFGFTDKLLKGEKIKIFNYDTAIGYNYRMSNICAGIGRGQMTVVQEHIDHHKHVQALYEELLKEVRGVHIHRQPADSCYDSNYWLCTATLDANVRVQGQENAYKEVIKTAVGGAAGVIKAVESATTDCQPNDNVEALRVFMAANRIETRPVWKPMHKQPVYADAVVYTNGVEEEIFKVGFCLPAGPWVTDEDVKYIVEKIKEAIL